MKKILHVDGDSFFASCEIAINPSLRGKPVVTGKERGIVSSMTYDAKAMGVTRGMPIFQLKKLFPSVIVVSSDYKLYSLFSQRMIHIVKRYSDEVHDYSIDECFADLTSYIEHRREKDEEIVARIKSDLQNELGMTFSLGLAPTKVLAKVASKTKKPNGLTIIREKDIKGFLKEVAIQKIWGIGRETSALLFKQGIRTALDFINYQDDVVRALVSKPYYEIYLELKGISVLSCVEDNEASKSISRTRTFSPPSNKKDILYSELSQNVEEACAAIRREGSTTRAFSFFIKTQEFSYRRLDFLLPKRTWSPMYILEIIKDNLDRIYSPKVLYRATGVTLMSLKKEGGKTEDLFGLYEKVNKVDELYKTVDRILSRFGSQSIFLGSSHIALEGRDIKQKERERKSFIHELAIPYLGEVK